MTADVAIRIPAAQDGGLLADHVDIADEMQILQSRRAECAEARVEVAGRGLSRFSGSSQCPAPAAAGSGDPCKPCPPADTAPFNTERSPHGAVGI